MLPLSIGLALCLVAGGRLPSARAQGMPKTEKVKFKTVDQVELHGTYWPSTRGRKAPCVLLLHKLGGKSHEDGWDRLAGKLQEEGCAVLSFDFRGHGQSTSVDPDFWKHNLYNRMGLRNSHKQGPTIAHADFKPGYAAYLVNDVSAARLYLDRRNDSGDCNSANIIVIGAEDGATLGNLWLYSEASRFRVTAGNPAFPATLRLSSKPESKDVIACIWLSLRPTLARSGVPLQSWLLKTGREQKIPMAFIYGKKDKGADAATLRLVQAIKPNYARGQKPMGELAATGDWGAETELAGSKLLASSLKTEEWITQTYLKKNILEKKADNEWEERGIEKAIFMWRFPGRQQIAKPEGEKNLQPIPTLAPFGVR
jgi:alpha-beta hydrolase superfamily lysophospholipase